MSNRIQLIATLVMLTASTKVATSLSPTTVNPFDGIKSISVQVAVGGTLDIKNKTGDCLFGNDGDRLKYFKHSLSTSISAMLNERGIAVDDESEDGLIISFWGRSIDQCESPKIFMFLMKVTVYYADGTGRCPADDVADIHTLLGVSSDDSLEETLKEYALTVLKQELRSPEHGNQV